VTDDWEQETLEIRFDTQRISVEKIREVINKEGFEAEIRGAGQSN
jgi:hypothetical protein